MHPEHDVPAIFFARIESASGPYRADDRIAIAYATPTVGRLVALDDAVRTRCTQYHATAIPEIVSAIVEHAAEPFVAGERLTLFFVDPAIARIQREASHSRNDVAATLAASRSIDGTSGDYGTGRHDPAANVSFLTDGAPHAPQVSEGEPMTLRAGDRMAHVGERVVLEPVSEPVAREVAPDERVDRAAANENKPDAERAAERFEHSSPALKSASATRARGVSVRLEWSAERVRRFISVVDRLFTIDRLGWYRHSLAMRLLIPDEIHAGDELADLEAMRHLHALRSAAVAALGKPLLAACMPGFTVTSDWLETLESSREARAVAGLRDALLPYAIDLADETHDRSLALDPAHTVGYVGKHALLSESATSLEAFLPILIPTVSDDAALCARLTDYRNLLVELFAQTARASDPVRLGALAQPNHSLDDRLWQLVGAVGEAFGSFVRS